MNCQHVRVLIHGYVDGELDLIRTLEIERHMRGCSDCAQAHKTQQALRSAIGASALYYPTPTHLQQRVQSSIRQAHRAASRPAVLSWRWIGLAAALAIVAIAAIVIARGTPGSGADDRLAEEVRSSHVRSLLANHLTDVASSDQHTVKPWFDGKLDFSPDVVDLASQGFPLAGGRLDYLDQRPVAALVYQRRRHVINLFIWPTTTPEAAPHDVFREGYHLLHWSQAGMTYWAVSDVSADDLQAFVQLYQQHAAPPAAP
jgi:anti-sigma factor RsiW